MDKEKRGRRLLIGAAAMLLCISGCAHSETVETQPSIGTVSQTEEVQIGSAPTTQTAPDQTQTDQATQNTTQATQPGQAETTGQEQTQPPKPVTDPLSAQQSLTVVQQATASLQSRLPDGKYDAGWSGGTAVPLTVAPGLSPAAMSADLVGKVQAMFEYESVACTYNLTYAGIADDGVNHKFVFSYIFEIPEIPKPDFNSQTVVSRVTQNVLASGLGVSAFDGGGAGETISLTNVPLFYDTDRATESLTDSVVWAIQSRNLAETVYTQFKLVYIGEGESSHEFLLYLK